MFHIRPVALHEAAVLAELAATTFRQSHGSSTTVENIDLYVQEQYTEEQFNKSLQRSENHYHVLLVDQTLAGFLNIIPNSAHEMIHAQPICKLDRIYLLEDYLDRKAGLHLFEFAKEEAIRMNQLGFWLNVWEGNTRAVRFYQKLGFQEVGKSWFRISATHSNPNLVLYLPFS